MSRAKAMHRLGGPIDICARCDRGYRRPERARHTVSHHIIGTDGIMRLCETLPVCSEACGVAMRKREWTQDGIQHLFAYGPPLRGFSR